MKRMPTLFIGHGSPMMALENTPITQNFKQLGTSIIETFGTPKGILAISAHWYTKGTFIQSAEMPTQIYDMYGFPKELYEVTYPVKGSKELTDEVMTLLQEDVTINDTWGIDHGMWTILVHMFPEGQIPVVQLSVNANLSTEESYRLGEKLQSLRDKGYLIMGSGNVVHNLGAIEYDNPSGNVKADAFDTYIHDAIQAGHLEKVIHYQDHPHSAYAVPTVEHYLPLLYILGSAYDHEEPYIFNYERTIGAISMTSYGYGLYP